MQLNLGNGIHIAIANIPLDEPAIRITSGEHSDRERTRALVLAHEGTTVAFPVLDAIGTTNIGHRHSTWSGIVKPWGSVTPGSNHTHQEHVLLNAPGTRQRVQFAAVDGFGMSWMIGSFVPGHLQDPTHQFFTGSEQFMQVVKRNEQGVCGATFGPALEMHEGYVRFGTGKSFLEFDISGKEEPTLTHAGKTTKLADLAGKAMGLAPGVFRIKIAEAVREDGSSPATGTVSVGGDPSLFGVVDTSGFKTDPNEEPATA